MKFYCQIIFTFHFDKKMNQQYQILQLKKKVEQNESEVHEKLSGLESQIVALTQQQNKHKVFS